MAQANANHKAHRVLHPLLVQATTAVRAGRYEEARTLLGRLVREEPANDEAWLRLAALTLDPRQARAYARQALRIAPRNPRAIRLLRQIEVRLTQSQTRTPAPSKASRSRRARPWLWASGLLLVLSILALGARMSGSAGARAWWTTPASPVLPTIAPPATPTPSPTPTQTVPERVRVRVPDLQEAWEARDWPAALRTLTEIAALDSAYPGLLEAQCDTYLQWAGELSDQGEIAESRAVYGRALPVCGDRGNVSAERDLALSYLAGQWRYNHGDWQGAVDALQEVYEARPGYADTQELLYTSYISSTHALLSSGQLRAAQRAAQAAQAIQPDSAEARALVRQIRARLAPTPTPTPAGGGKRIEVDISEQRMYVWEGERLVYKWVCSTGEPGRGTAAGRYRILDKIPEAWASTWGLRMPYWMGIYWAGSLENGIHALPINRSGTMLWAGYLGTPVSYGCVILSTENARTLYNWASVGTPVWIHY